MGRGVWGWGRGGDGVTGSRRRLTQAGAIMGTPGYMAPEQVVGAEADARSDQFSFCAALYEALYGRLPFPFSTWEEFVARVSEARLPAVLPRLASGVEIPTVVERALRRGLSRDPAERFGSMAELSAALEQGLRPDADSETTRRIKRRALISSSIGLVGFIAMRRLLAAGRQAGPTGRRAHYLGDGAVVRRQPDRGAQPGTSPARLPPVCILAER